MTAPVDVAKLRALHASASPWIELENVGRPYMPDCQPDADSRIFYESVHETLPACLDEIVRWRSIGGDLVQGAAQAVLGRAPAPGSVTDLRMEIAALRAALTEALDGWEASSSTGGYSSDVSEIDRIAELRKLVTTP